MKYLLITALFLTPLLSYAGGHQSIPSGSDCRDSGGDTPAPVVTPVPVTPTVVPPVVISPVVVPTPVVTPAPVSQSSGGGMIFCSGPLSPGWHVDIPGGGCAPVNKPVVVKLSEVPYTGLTFWEWLKQLW